MRESNYQKSEDIIVKFGQRVRFFRKKKGYTIQELADFANVEYSQISRIERGLIGTSITMIFVLAEVLEVSPSDLININKN